MQNNQIKHYSITVKNVNNVIKIWNKNTYVLKIKIIRIKSKIITKDIINIPTTILKLYKKMFLITDLFVVNKILFFMILSQQICFIVFNYLINCKILTIFVFFNFNLHIKDTDNPSLTQFLNVVIKV